jgi:hypothetical protein
VFLAEWFTGGFGKTCVEVRFDDDHVSVRDSEDPAGAILTFTRTEWAAFLRSTATGEFAPER